MKALILNSGIGSRMGVLTSEHPKCMTEIFGMETILSRQLKQLNEFGIKEVVITTGLYADVLQKYVSSLNLPLKVSYVHNAEFKDTNYIYSIYCARKLLDDDLILMHGDLVFDNQVFDAVLQCGTSCMTVSSTLELPQKDFKAVILDGCIQKVGIDYFQNAMAAQPLYKLEKSDWKIWLDKIVEFCEHGQRKCYAEDAFGKVSDRCKIYPLDVKDLLCNEIDTPEDLELVSGLMQQLENRTVYISFSTDVIHSGHIALIKKARRLGNLIVGVISDQVVASYKRYPLLPYAERKILFENIIGVKKVVEQTTLSYKENIEKYHPTYVVHGDDWKEGFQKPIRDEVIALLSSYGGKLIEFPYATDAKYKTIEKQFSYEQKMIYIENRYGELDAYLKENHVQRLFLVCGHSVESHPLLQYLMNEEERNGIQIIRFSDFASNPTYESVVEGLAKFEANQCDTILAVGGGSAIDVAKCIKLFSGMDSTQSYLEQRIEENNIPLLVVPTTAGTGSEVTRFAVIYHNGIKQSITHESCVPSMVFMDPSFLKTVPVYHRKSTLLDALCHSIESFWSVNATEESKAYAREAIALILENREAYLNNESQGNVNMQRASQLAGKAINITQTTAGHAMCYMLTSIYGIAHGHAAALCVAELWPYMLSHIHDCVDRRGERYIKQTMRELATAFECDTPSEAADRFRETVVCMGFEPLYSKGEDIEVLVNNVKMDRLQNYPIRLGRKAIREVYQKIIGMVE